MTTRRKFKFHWRFQEPQSINEKSSANYILPVSNIATLNATRELGSSSISRNGIIATGYRNSFRTNPPTARHGQLIHLIARNVVLTSSGPITRCLRVSYGDRRLIIVKKREQFAARCFCDETQRARCIVNARTTEDEHILYLYRTTYVEDTPS